MDIPKYMEYLLILILLQRPYHAFKQSMKLEAIDVLNPIRLYPVTIIKVAAHMLLLQYDGWDRGIVQNTVWMDSSSPDIFPLGYSDLVGQRLENYPVSPNPKDLLLQLTRTEELEEQERAIEQARIEKEIWENSIVQGVPFEQLPE